MGKTKDHTVSPYPVTLHYLSELDATTMKGILARDVTLYTAKVRIATDEHVAIERHATVEVVKPASCFSAAKARLKGRPKSVSIRASKLAFKPREHWSIEDMIEHIIMPAIDTRGGNVALAYTLDSRHVCATKYGGYYVSVPYDIWFHGFVGALKHLFQDQDPKQVYLWLDFVSANPAMTAEQGASFQAALPELMAKFSGHVVYFDGWGAVSNTDHRKEITALHDGRCLYELYCARKANLETLVAMRPPTRREFLQSLREGGLAYFEEHLRKLFVPESPSRVYDMAALVKGLDGDLLHEVRSQLEIWFVREFAAEADKIKAKHDILYEQAARDLNRVAVIHSRNGDIDTAARLFRDVIELRMAGKGELDPSTAFAKNNLALLLQKQGKFEEAKPLLQEAISILEDDSEDHSTRIAVIVGNLANVLEMMGDLRGAESERKHLVFLRRAQLGDKHIDVARALNAVGALQLKQNKVEQAKVTLLEALAIWEQGEDQGDDDINRIVENLASVYELECDHDHPDHGGEHHVEIAKVLYNLARIYKRSEGEEHAHHAKEYGERAVNVMREVLGESHPETLKYQDELLQ